MSRQSPPPPLEKAGVPGCQRLVRDGSGGASGEQSRNNQRSGTDARGRVCAGGIRVGMGGKNHQVHDQDDEKTNRRWLATTSFLSEKVAARRKVFLGINGRKKEKITGSTTRDDEETRPIDVGSLQPVSSAKRLPPDERSF